MTEKDPWSGVCAFGNRTIYEETGYGGAIGMNFQDYKSVQDAAAKWVVTVRQVQKMCSKGKIVGVIRFGNAWAIPCET